MVLHSVVLHEGVQSGKKIFSEVLFFVVENVAKFRDTIPTVADRVSRVLRQSSSSYTHDVQIMDKWVLFRGELNTVFVAYRPPGGMTGHEVSAFLAEHNLSESLDDRRGPVHYCVRSSDISTEVRLQQNYHAHRVWYHGLEQYR